MTYGYIYVAQIALGANMAQAVKAIAEAEALPRARPSSSATRPANCTASRAGMTNCQNEMKKAVEGRFTGNLFTFKPGAEGRGQENPFTPDLQGRRYDQVSGLPGPNETPLQPPVPCLPRARQGICSNKNQKAAEDRYEHLTRLVDLYK